MPDLTEHQARRSEIELMIGRLNAVSCDGRLNADQRMGACHALKVLENRRQELDIRKPTHS